MWLRSMMIALGMAVLTGGSPAWSAPAEKAPDPSQAQALDHVRAALQAEAAGDNDRRAEELAAAARCAPDLPAANWHLGRVGTAGHWVDLALAEQQGASEPKWLEYRRLRDEAQGSTPLLRELARWCMKQGWQDAARVHSLELLQRADVSPEMTKEAIKRLNLHQISGMWISGRQLAATREHEKAIAHALGKWRPRLKKLQIVVDGPDDFHRQHALKELRQIDDPQIIPALQSFLADGGDRFQEEAVRCLARFPHYEATQALVAYAVDSPFLSARDAATEALHTRSVYEYCPPLLGRLVAPIQSQSNLAVDARGRVSFLQATTSETPRLAQVRIDESISIPTQRMTTHRTMNWYETSFLQNEILVYSLRADAAELQATAANQSAAPRNRRIITVLERATGQQLGQDPRPWWEWWQEYNQKWLPKVSQFVYRGQQRSFPMPVGHSCFVAGTPVHTAAGLAPIETLQAGDRVLSQDADTGELAYKLVTATTVRPPGTLVRLDCAGETITATLGHPFWVNGAGWKMAKELRAGDLLHTTRGAVRIDTLETLPEPQEAYNLVVQDFDTYFVGRQGVLVHDNEFRRPTRAIVPGLVPEAPAVGDR